MQEVFHALGAPDVAVCAPPPTGDPAVDRLFVIAAAVGRHVAGNANPAYTSEYPTTARLDAELCAFGLELFGAPPEAKASTTAGGTESIMLAARAAGRRHRTLTGRRDAELVCASTRHPAVDKAADLLGVTMRVVPVAPDTQQPDQSAIAAEISPRTALVVLSAPSLAWGAIDPVGAIGEWCAARDVWLHVDACIGGFLSPFVRRLGAFVPSHDFTLPGVSSISADLHKFGYAPKGVSMVLYRDLDLWSQQGFSFDAGPLGSFSSEAFAGTRSGAVIAGAWAVLQHLGVDGLTQLARRLMAAKRQLADGLERIDEVEVHRAAHLNCLPFTVRSVDVDDLAREMARRGWPHTHRRIFAPDALQLWITPESAARAARYLKDLARAVSQCQRARTRG
jgi:glutamate/tyrosine decarboxylase-like PLP-dependent enzyme